MTNKQINRILTGIGLSTAETSFPDFRTLILTTNHGIDPLRDKISFDTSDGLIKIKQYEYRYNQEGIFQTRPYSDYEFDIALDLDILVGIESCFAQVGLS